MTSIMKKLMLTAAVIASPLMAQADGHGDDLSYILVSHAPDSDT